MITARERLVHVFVPVLCSVVFVLTSSFAVHRERCLLSQPGAARRVAQAAAFGPRRRWRQGSADVPVRPPHLARATARLVLVLSYS